MARTVATNFSGGLAFPYATAAANLCKKEDIQTLALAVDQHTHGTGKGLPINVAGIPNGAITSAMIANGTIVGADIAPATIAGSNIASGTITSGNIAAETITGGNILNGSLDYNDIAAHAITSSNGPVVGVTNNPTTTSTGFVDLPDMAISIPGVLAGADLLVWFGVTTLHSVLGGQITVAANLDGVDTPGLSQSWAAAAGGIGQAGGVYVWKSVAAGTRTVKLRWLTGSGTATAYSVYRSMVVLQLNR